MRFPSGWRLNDRASPKGLICPEAGEGPAAASPLQFVVMLLILLVSMQGVPDPDAPPVWLGPGLPGDPPHTAV